MVFNFGVGVDIESISRFKRAEVKGDRSFLNKIFTGAELKYCLSCPVPAQHLAARFAAKEAVIKALAGLDRAIPGYKDIEITNDKNGVPSARILKSGFDDLDIRLSLSHSKGEAIAFVMVVGPSKAYLMNFSMYLTKSSTVVNWDMRSLSISISILNAFSTPTIICTQ
jgi:holo-[acyl-carrier protein] synthase